MFNDCDVIFLHFSPVDDRIIKILTSILIIRVHSWHIQESFTKYTN